MNNADLLAALDPRKQRIAKWPSQSKKPMGVLSSADTVPISARA